MFCGRPAHAVSPGRLAHRGGTSGPTGSAVARCIRTRCRALRCTRRARGTGATAAGPLGMGGQCGLRTPPVWPLGLSRPALAMLSWVWWLSVGAPMWVCLTCLTMRLGLSWRGSLPYLDRPVYRRWGRSSAKRRAGSAGSAGSITSRARRLPAGNTGGGVQGFVSTAGASSLRGTACTGSSTGRTYALHKTEGPGLPVPPPPCRAFTTARIGTKSIVCLCLAGFCSSTRLPRRDRNTGRSTCPAPASACASTRRPTDPWMRGEPYTGRSTTLHSLA